MAQRRADDEQVHLLSNSPINQTSYSSQAQSASPESQSTTFRFESSSQFRLLRFLLRFLSLWCPRSACCFERWLYPLLVNFMFLAMVVGTLWNYNILKDHFYLQRLIYFFLNLSAWFSHIAGVIFFRSRDVEDNMTEVVLCAAMEKTFRKRLTFYTARIAASLLLIPMYSVGIEILLTNNMRRLIHVLGMQGLHLKHEKVTFQFPVFAQWLSFAAVIHLPGMYIAILWIVDLLHITSKTRLQKQYEKFLIWRGSVDLAISDHITNYTDKVKMSCRSLQYWFKIHNGFLFLISPTFVFSSFKLLFGGYSSSGLVIFTNLLLFLLLVWTLPFYFASEIEQDDEIFRDKVNEFCEFSLLNTSTGAAVVDNRDDQINADSARPSNLTFASRSNVTSLLFFLKTIKSGFRSVGFSFQLKASLYTIFFTFYAVVVRYAYQFH